jgi:hypothetical protein
LGSVANEGRTCSAREIAMMNLDDPLDCPECGSAGSVYREFCEICDAEFGEVCAEEPSAGRSRRAAVPPVRRLMHPSIPLRFSDVVRELREIAELASQAVEVEGTKLAAACRRAESLLYVLRAQFLQDVVLADRPARAL